MAAARENARSIREVVSLETWEAINELYLWMGGARARRVARGPPRLLPARPAARTQLCLGVVRGTMLHDDAIDFILLGVMLERAGQTARILDVHHHALRQLPPNVVARPRSGWRCCAPAPASSPS